MAEEHWHWAEGIVNMAHEHMKLYHGEFGSEAKLVALLSPPTGRNFTVQFLMEAETGQNKVKRMLDDVKESLNFYLITHPEKYPDTGNVWDYAIYHAGSVADMHDKVHWEYYKEGWIND
jgi:hypothetical protein